MKKHEQGDRAREPAGPRNFLLLEEVTALVLIVNMAALAWMLIVAYQPTWLRLASLEREVIVVTVLLVAALLLVSLVALLHTRDRPL